MFRDNLGTVPFQLQSRITVIVRTNMRPTVTGWSQYPTHNPYTTIDTTDCITVVRYNTMLPKLNSTWSHIIQFNSPSFKSKIFSHGPYASVQAKTLDPKPLNRRPKKHTPNACVCVYLYSYPYLPCVSAYIL